MRPFILACIGFAITALPVAAVAETSTANDTKSPAPLTDDELDAQRGGFETPTGVNFSFGAVVDTYVDGKLALQTQLTLTPQGAQQTTTGTISSGLAAEAARAGIQLNANAQGAFIPGTNGGTVVLNSANGNQIVNTVLNTADNRNISQTTTVNIGITNLAQYQAQANVAQLALQLQNSVATAAGLRTH